MAASPPWLGADLADPTLNAIAPPHNRPPSPSSPKHCFTVLGALDKGDPDIFTAANPYGNIIFVGLGSTHSFSGARTAGDRGRPRRVAGRRGAASPLAPGGDAAHAPPSAFNFRQRSPAGNTLYVGAR
jgi:hypothetical protein